MKSSLSAQVFNTGVAFQGFPGVVATLPSD